MNKSILVRGARQLLTLYGPAGPRRGDALRQIGLIEDGSVLIVNGTISSVGPTRRIENLAEARKAEELNVSGRVVMPGFIDSHTHVISAPGRLSEYRLHGNVTAASALDETGFAAVLQYVRNTPGGTLEHNAAKHLESCLRHGTTTLEGKTGYGLNAPAELKMLRVLGNLNARCMSVVATFLGAHVVPPESAVEPREYVDWLCSEMLPKLKDRKMAQFVDVLCEPGGFSAEDARVYLMHARRLGLPVKVHGDQSDDSGACSLAVEMQATSVDGLNRVTSADAEMLARSDTVATLLPALVHQGTFDRFPPARSLIDSGAAVALATGFHPSVSSTFSMQMVVSLACTHMNFSAEEALSAATINGAHALGRGVRCGSLEYGKDADLIVLNVSDYREIPFFFGGNLISLVMHRGDVVYRENPVECADE